MTSSMSHHLMQHVLDLHLDAIIHTVKTFLGAKFLLAGSSLQIEVFNLNADALNVATEELSVKNRQPDMNSQCRSAGPRRLHGYKHQICNWSM